MPAASEAEPVWFVDGVRRVELRLVADQDGRRAPGLFGTYAVGSVRCDGRATFGEHAVGRAVILAGGLVPERVEIATPSGALIFEPVTDPGDTPDRPLWKLQDLMRDAEAALAARLAGRDQGAVLVDGPLSLRDPTHAPVVGVVKRFARHYLDDAHEGLLTRLAPGERTPLFGLGLPNQPVNRLAWYTRLVPMRPHWHDHAGVVRCEVSASVGPRDAAGLADRVAAMLPAFAGRPSDPRAPQNLSPVGGLETWLRHRMGHAGILRRALTAWLLGEVRAASGAPA